MDCSGGNITNSSFCDTSSPRIVLAVINGIAMLVAGLILTITLHVKAYRSILQRFFMYLVLALLIQSFCYVASVFYKFHRGDTVLQLLDERACQYLGFLTVWSSWCVFTIIIAAVLYLVILILTRTRNCPACVVKIRNSRRLRIFLEVCTMLGVLLGPLLVLWIPFYDTWYTYGFNGAMCAILEANPENKSSTDITLVIYLYGGAIVQLTGLTALLGAIVVLLNYFTLPANLRHALAKKLTMKIVHFFFAVIVYIVVRDLGQLCARIKQPLLANMVASLLPLIVLSAILITYLVAFQFSIKNFFKRKKEKLQVQHQERQTSANESLKDTQTRDYGSLEDCEPSKTRSTHFSVPYTGEFTTITELI